mgnify:CR=1 FL=1
MILPPNEDIPTNLYQEKQNSTRIGGKLVISAKPRKILVDIREFRSKLPSSLFYKVRAFTVEIIVTYDALGV